MHVLEERTPCKELNLEGAHVSKNEKKIRVADGQGVKGNETRMRAGGRLVLAQGHFLGHGEDIVFPHHKQYDIFEEY